MARKKTDWPASVHARIAALAARGGTAESISAKLLAEGIAGASRATIGRHLRALRTGAAPAPAASSVPAAAPSRPATKSKGKPKPPMSAVDAADPPLPSTAEAIPDGVDLATLDRWVERAEKAAKKAERDGNLQALGAMGRLATALLEAKRKAAPLPEENLDEQPDMIALGKQCAERLHKLIDQVVEP